MSAKFGPRATNFGRLLRSFSADSRDTAFDRPSSGDFARHRPDFDRIAWGDVGGSAPCSILGGSFVGSVADCSPTLVSNPGQEWSRSPGSRRAQPIFVRIRPTLGRARYPTFLQAALALAETSPHWLEPSPHTLGWIRSQRARAQPKPGRAQLVEPSPNLVEPSPEHIWGRPLDTVCDREDGDARRMTPSMRHPTCVASLASPADCRSAAVASAPWWMRVATALAK